MLPADRLPITHEVFQGNIAEVATVRGIVERLPFKRLILVADRGLLSEANLAMLEGTTLPDQRPVEYAVAVAARRFRRYAGPLTRLHPYLVKTAKETGEEAPAKDALPRRHDPRHVTPGILPFALRARRRFKTAPGGFVEPQDFIARLVALVPKPRFNLTRFHGVFAPNSKYSARVTPAKRGRGGVRLAQGDSDEPTPAERRAAMSLKRSVSSGCLTLTSRPARPVAGRCKSSPASRMPR